MSVLPCKRQYDFSSRTTKNGRFENNSIVPSINIPVMNNLTDVNITKHNEGIIEVKCVMKYCQSSPFVSIR